MFKPRYTFSILLIMMLGLTLFSCRNDNRKNQTKENNQAAKTSKAPKTLYNINIDTLEVTTGKVKRNQFLADILLPQKVSYSTIDLLAKRSKPVFDVRKIRRGHNYTLISSRDSIPKILYFVYEISPSNYVVYHLVDSVYAELGKKPIERINKTIKGKVKTSLWNAFTDKGNDPNLAIKISEIYAWTIDFFEIQKSDAFKVIVPELYIDGKYVGFDNPLAANFIHKGVSHFAFYFEQNGKGDYFDETGKSLERKFLKAPLKYRRISSRFTNHRWHPILKIYRPHHGVDYAAAEGTPVHALGDGIIVGKGYQRAGGGNYLKIKHNSIYTTQYAHLRAFARGMKVGKHVRQGQLIGFVGHTGLATGPHLDFRVYKYGRPINPLNLKSPPAKPIAKAYRPAFDSLVKHYKPLLDSL